MSAAATTSDSRRTTPFVALSALLVVTTAAYVPAWHAPEIFDDPAVIDENPSITHLLPLSIPLRPPVQSPVAGRPVSNLTLAVNYTVNRLLGVDQRPGPAGPWKTASYHVLNVLLHCCSGLLLFGIVRRTLAHGRWQDRWSTSAGGVAFLVAAVWLLHPLQTEAVDYLAQRTELVVSLCCIGTLYCAIRSWDAASGRTRAGWVVAGVLTCLLGMGAKEVMVSAPIIVVLYDLAFRADDWRALSDRARRARLGFYGALFATIALLVALIAPGPRNVSAGWNVGLRWYQYLFTQGWAVPRYLRLVFWPTGLLFDYGMTPAPIGRALPGLVLLTILGAGTIVAWSCPRWRWLGFCGAWFFLLLAPSSSIISVSTEVAAESRVYLAWAGVLVVVVVGSAAAVRRFGGLRAAQGVAATLVALLAVMSFVRSELYRSPEAVWRDSIAKLPTNARAWNNLGFVLIHRAPPAWTPADSLFRRAVALDSAYATAWFNLAAAADHRHDEDAARTDLEHVITLAPRDQQALSELGSLFLAAGDAIHALPYLERADDAAADASELVNLGRASMATGHAAEAVTAFRQAISRDSTRIDALDDLGSLLTEEGFAGQAAPLLLKAVQRDDRSGLSWALLSLADADLGRPAQAVQLAAHSVRESGDNLSVYFYAGRAMLVAGQPKLAETYLLRVTSAGVANTDADAALGVAEALLGKPASAALWYRRALQLDPANGVARAGMARLASPDSASRTTPARAPASRHRIGAA